MKQTGYALEEDKYAEIADTLVYVYEPDEETYADASFAVDELDIFEGVASLPILVYLSQSPSSDVTIVFEPVFNEDENAGSDASELNDESVVTFEPSELSFVSWDEVANFTVKVSGWDLTKGESFRVYISYSGTNAESYTDSEENYYIKLNVLSSDSAPTPEITLDEESLEVDTYEFTVEATCSTMGYAYWLLLPEG